MQYIIDNIKNSNSKIFLVENISDVENLQIDKFEKIGFVSQTTLSMDDTASIIDALKEKIS